jgi:hypothetical protein
METSNEVALHINYTGFWFDLLFKVTEVKLWNFYDLLQHLSIRDRITVHPVGIELSCQEIAAGIPVSSRSHFRKTHLCKQKPSPTVITQGSLGDGYKDGQSQLFSCVIRPDLESVCTYCAWHCNFYSAMCSVGWCHMQTCVWTYLRLVSWIQRSFLFLPTAIIEHRRRIQSPETVYCCHLRQMTLKKALTDDYLVVWGCLCI